MAYGDFKYLFRRTALLRDKAFDITQRPKYRYQRDLASVVYKFVNKKSATRANKFAVVHKMTGINSTLDFVNQ